MSIDFVILAGGSGSRMHSSTTPKIFQKIAGMPCIKYPINACRKIDSSANIIVVTKHEFAHDPILNDVTVVVQENPLGTGDALKCALPFITNDYVVVMCADMPLIQATDLTTLVNNNDASSSLIAMKIPETLMNMAYGRVIVKDHKFVKIIEYKDANNSEKNCSLANSGVYKFKTDALKININNVTMNNKGGEYYLTDVFNCNNDVDVIVSDDYSAFHGINTMSDLSLAENIMQNRLRKMFMDNGVKLLDPSTVYFSADTEIEQDVVIEENVVIKECVRIQSKSVIKSFSYLEKCVIGEGVKIGPFARIRGDAVMNERSEIGNFVEVKGSTIGKGTKIKHLSYIGDAALGEKVNIGAGVITCNYDGFNKHKTQIENGAMIGANCSLVAPIHIGAMSIVAAGSTIVSNVPNNCLGIARSRQENKKDYAIKIRENKQKPKV